MSYLHFQSGVASQVDGLSLKVGRTAKSYHLEYGKGTFDNKVVESVPTGTYESSFVRNGLNGKPIR